MLFSLSRLAILKSKSEYEPVLNLWFLGILGHFLFAFSLPITRLTKYFEYFIILIMPYTIQYLNSIWKLQIKDKIYNFKWGCLLYTSHDSVGRHRSRRCKADFTDIQHISATGLRSANKRRMH